jgi:hypothetical protein
MPTKPSVAPNAQSTQCHVSDGRCISVPNRNPGSGLRGGGQIKKVFPYFSCDRIEFCLALIGSDLAVAHLVSVDHFKYELILQLRSAAAQGATKIVVNSSELCRSIRNGSHSTQACCEAMEAEIKPGDVVIEQRGGTGMTVRYLLPRKNG